MVIFAAEQNPGLAVKGVSLSQNTYVFWEMDFFWIIFYGTCLDEFLIINFYMSLCVFAHVHVHACLWCTYMLIPKDNPEAIPQAHLSLPVEQGLLLAWNSPRRLGWVAGKTRRSILLSLSP